MAKRKLKIKTYEINIDMTWSESKKVKARSIGEAKKKAWLSFKKRCPKNNFKIVADRIDE